MADITYIPIRQLHPHPDNPRKELGDLSELSASIKENGVYQNLTVIPGHYLSSREYISKCVDEGGDAAAAKIRMGQSKNFRPGTLKKYQAEMKKLEAEQKKRRDELMDKGNEILAALGKE